MSTNMTVTCSCGTLELVRESFMDGIFSMRLPDCLQKLSKEEIQKRFLAAQVPQLIKMDTENKLIFTMDINALDLDSVDEDDVVKDTLFLQRRVLSRMTPGYQEYGMKNKKLENHLIGCLNYKSNALEEDMYNVFYTFICHSKIISGAFSCPSSHAKEWNELFLICLDTLKIEDCENTNPVLK